MPEHFGNERIVAWKFHQQHRAGHVPELVSRHPQASALLHDVADLTAQTLGGSEMPVLSREQPALVRAPHQHRPVNFNVLTDEVRQLLIERKVECDAVLDLVRLILEPEPTLRSPN